MALLVEADRSLRVARRVEHVEDKIADAHLLAFCQIAAGGHGLQLEAIVVAAVEPIRVVGMDRQRCPRGLDERRVVEDVVDVPVRVRDEVQPQPTRLRALHERLRGAHAGVDNERLGRASVPDEVGVRLPWPEGADLDPHGVRAVLGRNALALDDRLIGHCSRPPPGPMVP